MRLGVVMDPIQFINIKKDTTFALLLAAMQRRWSLTYMEQSDLFCENGVAKAHMQTLTVQRNPKQWFQLSNSRLDDLANLDVILMRKDPPFNMEYIYTTYLLELAMSQGSLIVNHPQSLRDANEKLFTAWFPQCCPPTLVSRDPDRIRNFLQSQQHIVVKPLDGMGGAEIFSIKLKDLNTNVILETLTQQGQRTVMAQRFIPEFKQGDKRILMVNGQAIPYALARIPKSGELRGNLAAGGSGQGQALSDRDRWICEQVGPVLKAKGLLFVGLDIIGDYLTEINVTCPTCLVELESAFNLDISDEILNTIEDLGGK